jgi:hypothetical protein
MFGKCLLSCLLVGISWSTHGAVPDDTVSTPVLPELSTSRSSTGSKSLEISLLQDGKLRHVVALLPPAIGALQQRSTPDASVDVPTGSIVVLLDAFNPTFPTSEQRRAAAEKLLRRIDSESPIAVYVADPELHVIRDFVEKSGRSQRFTRQVSRDEVKAALRTFDARPTNGHLVHELHIADIQNFQLSTLESIASHVADLPGKKALIWFCQTSGFSIEDMRPSSSLYIPMVLLLRALQASDMSIYSIDCFGRHLPPRWTPPEFGAVDMTGLHPSAPKYGLPKSRTWINLRSSQVVGFTTEWISWRRLFQKQPRI